MAYDKKSWTEFRETGLFHFVNSFLHLFGWAIVLSEEDDGSTEVFPARTDYRGFPQESNDTAYNRVTEFLRKEFQAAPVEAKTKKGGRNEGLANFRFKDPESDDDLIGIEDFICEVYRRNKGEDAAEKIQDLMDNLQSQAGSQYIKEKGKDAFDKLEGAACAQFLFNAIRSTVNGITQEDFRMVYTSPGTDKEYLQEVVLCDKEVEPPEYRTDDKYDFSSLRK